MLKNIILIAFFLSIGSAMSYAQVEKIIVETYYVADADDATNTSGGQLEVGTKTYRVFVDLVEGSKITKLYGDQNHALIFSSTAPFFNSVDDGVSTGYNMNRNRLKDNTVALDSWLTLGQTTKSGTSALYGVLKENDKDGSIIGGSNNDGGSAAISSGLLKNNAPLLGVPLTTSDGYTTHFSLPNSWIEQGFSDDVSVFGSTVHGSKFYSKASFIKNSGTEGAVPVTNHVLIAQLTTLGEISFEVNIEVINKDGQTINYVASDSVLLNNEVFLPLLKYPAVCGCQNPNFLEYSNSFSCGDASKCKTPIVFGCLDSLACNFNPNANFNVSTLCCYVGYCNDINIEVICPNLPPRNSETGASFSFYPNPAEDKIYFQHNINENSKSKIEIIDNCRRIVFSQVVNQNAIELENFPSGFYTVRFSNGDFVVSKRLIIVH